MAKKRYVVVITDSVPAHEVIPGEDAPCRVWVSADHFSRPRTFPTIDAARAFVDALDDWNPPGGEERQVSVHLLTGTVQGLQRDDAQNTVLTGGNIAQSGRPYNMDSESIATL